MIYIKVYKHPLGSSQIMFSSEGGVMKSEIQGGGGDDDGVSGEEKDESFLLCLDRLPSRNSSMSCSSRLYYRSTEGVPFQWEMQPGTPKDHPPLKEAIPPLSPPPGILSLKLGRPKLQSRQTLFGSWRKHSAKSKKHQQQAKKYSSSDKFDQRFQSCGSDCDFTESPRKTSSSSSSSSSSLPLSKDPALPSASPDHWRLGCSPWSINTIKVAIGRRV